ncbi:uncharacterized protein EKO05_0009197 [Ascochyta rabiei]|uniref:Uncharacterized protein n=1 Tax=Didymella rabiei TaxID=5454 RepID=A0A163ISI3_DIDRA|nr:uncharacterized protein EKO05_0009197 [Ascochyta rabiei]KZM25914.1 hypothetical protein ST47_g2984 [Ascochyta rabiei]UPX18914.1 hypothetical protein EKO05_0009197 [Ascochyta rabiei]
MAPGSMKETIKALDNTFGASDVPYPLPEELCATIQSFLDRYDNIDDHDSQRFHEDLHALYQRHVAEHAPKHGAFLSALRLVRPALTGEARLTTWWNLVLKPTIDGIGHKRHAIEDAREVVQSILVYDAEEDQNGDRARVSSLLTQKILDAYLRRTNVSNSADNVVSPENEFIANELESVLVTFGRKMPKLLLSALDELFVQKQHRMQALGLLSAFVRLQPPHLHLVLDTSLLHHLEKCLLIDTSTTVIELALVVLIMLLPHICGALTSNHHLPKLFLIYSRVLCWDKLSKLDDQNMAHEHGEKDFEDSEEEQDDEENDQAWEQLQPVEGEEEGSPTLMHYFTFLYGLFPLNFMSFIRRSRKYLKSLNFPGAQDFDLDQDLIHSRTEPYRLVHLLHPNIFTTTIEEELSENRWLKSDPADVVTDCMDLCVAVSATLEDPGPPPASKLPPIPPLPEVPAEFVLDDSDISWRNTQSTMFVPPEERPSMPDTVEMPLRSKSVASVQSFKSASPLLKTHDTMDSPTLPPTKDAMKQTLLNASTAPEQRQFHPQPNLDSFARSVTGTSSPSHPHLDSPNQSMASLQREIMLLRNDLNFERYLKLQHLSHIGQLQRKHIREAAVEADTQNLINANKTLKARLNKANELYAQLKKETLTSRNQSKKWESDLNAKVRTYRDSEKTWHSEEDKLRFELQRTQSDYEHLKRIVEKAEAEQLRAEQRTRALEYELEDYSNVRHELKTAQQKIIEYEDQTQDLHLLTQQRNDLRNDLEIANMRLNSREAEREHSVTAYERRIMTLEQRLQATERTVGPPGQLSSSVQQMLDSVLAASHAKLQSLKKAHQNLATQHTDLQMKYQDLEAEHQAALGRFSTHEKTGHHEYAQSQLSRNSSLREANSYGSQHLPPLSTQTPINEEREYFSEYHSPNSVSSPNSAISSAAQRPPRLDSMPSHGSQRSQRSPPGPSMYPAFGGSLHPDLYEPQALARSNAAVQSSGKSSLSVDTDGSGGRADKDKVEAKSEVRVYGRGGAQNIGKKVKDKEQKKSSSSKTGGFRGLRGIM